MTTRTLAEALEDAVRESIALDAPLDQRLGVVRDAVRELSPTFAEAVDRMVDRLRAAEAGIHAPASGEQMPPFLLPDSDGRLVTLESLLADGPVVVAFHRGHWCPYCRLHAIALGEVRRMVEAEGARIVAIAPDKRNYNAELRREAGGGIPILTDVDNGYALALNLAIWVGQEMQELMSSSGFALDLYQGNDGWMLPIPATFLVGQNGKIVMRHLDPDYRRRVDVDLLLTSLRALRQAA
jgi:peroxiredoxin